MSRMVHYIQFYFDKFLILGVLAFLVLSLGYLLVKKFLWKGKKVCRFSTVVFTAIFFAYLFVVLAITLLSRPSEMYIKRQIVPLFYSYKNAWYSSPEEWWNIIANILMFVPFGCLLPMSIRWFQSFIKTYLAGLVFTVGIETFQYIKGRGVCEMDDVLNNFLGAMIGYGIFVVGKAVLEKLKKTAHGAEERTTKSKNSSQLSIFLLQLPLIVTVLVAGILYAVYQNQELGILACAWNSGYHLEDGQVQSKITYKTEKGTLPVYKINPCNYEDAEDIAKKMFAYLGISMDHIEVEKDDESVYFRDGQENSIWIEYEGGSISYSNFSDAEEGKENMQEDELREKMHQFGMFIPKEAKFENLGNGWYTFIADMCKEGKMMYDGELNVVCCGDEGNITSLNNSIMVCEVYKEYSIRSEQEAYERIVDGKFPYPIYYEKEKGTIEVEKSYIDYQLDSKGFYQPVYVFPVNAEFLSAITIPAIS